MSLQMLNKAADECFMRSMPQVRTQAEHEAAIDVWNKIIDDAIGNAIRAKAAYIDAMQYEHAVIARDLAVYFEAMKATKDAPFPIPR